MTANANKGRTKAALKQRLSEVIDREIAYDVAQFGPAWTLDALREVTQEVVQRYASHIGPKL